MIRLEQPFPVALTFGSARVVRVRLGETGPGVASYLPPGVWRELAFASTDGPWAHVSTGELDLSVSADCVEFAGHDGAPRLRLALGETRLRPHLLLRMQILGEQHFYGLGAGGPQFDRLGAVRRFWNFQANRAHGADIAIPLLLSNRGYGVFFDSAALATLAPGDAGDGTWIEYTTDASSLDFYFIGGTSLRQVLGDVAVLLGRAVMMPPRWALGYLQSSRHFADVAEIRGLAHTFRAKRLPCEALICLSS